MKKVLAVFHETEFSEGVFYFAEKLNAIEPILLNGVFLPEHMYTNIWNYGGGIGGPAIVPPVSEAVVAVQNEKKFVSLCKHHNIAYSIQNDFSSLAMPQLKKETRFADLMIIGSERFNAASPGLEEILHITECPAVIVPETFEFPESNVLAYDGSPSSVFAIKLFAYLFPQFCNNKTILAYSKGEDDQDFPEKEEMDEFAMQHFSNYELVKLQWDSGRDFSSWVLNHKKSIVVAGAFGRSLFSQIFQKSFISDLIKEHHLPVFIAHR